MSCSIMFSSRSSRCATFFSGTCWGDEDSSASSWLRHDEPRDRQPMQTTSSGEEYWQRIFRRRPGWLDMFMFSHKTPSQCCHSHSQQLCVPLRTFLRRASEIWAGVIVVEGGDIRPKPVSALPAEMLWVRSNRCSARDSASRLCPVCIWSFSASVVCRSSMSCSVRLVVVGANG